MEFEKSIALIESSGLLKSHHELAELKTELEDTFSKVQMFRTRTEMEISVLNDAKHATPDAKYWQAVREQDVFFTNLVMTTFDYKEKQVEVKKLERQLADESDNLEKELLSIRIAKEKYVLALMEREGAHRIRELKEWSDIKKELEPQCSFSLDDVNAHQLRSYNISFQRQAQLIEGQEVGAADRINIVGKAHTSGKKVKELREGDKIASLSNNNGK